MSTTESFTGSQATGSDGATGRTITLANREITVAPGFYVFANGLFLHLTTDYTVSHNSSSTVITFVNALFNDQLITIIYSTLPAPSPGIAGILPADVQLINKEITYFGDTVTVRLVTDSSYSKWGDATESTSDTASVKCVVNDLTPEELKETEGIFQNAEKRFFFQSSQSNLSNGNRIIYPSITNETYTGSNATGSDGAINRTLTLSNTSLTSNSSFYVFVGGVLLTLTTDYTVVHASSSTVITFLNALFNTQNISVVYEASSITYEIVRVIEHRLANTIHVLEAWAKRT